MRTTSQRLPVALLAVAAAGLAFAPLTASAAPAKTPARPAAGKWSFYKADSDGYEKKPVMTISKGGTKVTRLALTPTQNCTGPQISVVGTLPIKQKKKGKNPYYVSKTPHETLQVTVTQGGVKSVAGLSIGFQGSRFADVDLTLSTAGECHLSFVMRKQK